MECSTLSIISIIKSVVYREAHASSIFIDDRDRHVTILCTQYVR